MTRRSWAFLTLLVVVVGGLLVWQRGQSDAQPHRLPVAVQGPPVVAQAVADRLDALPGDPVDASVLDPDADPRAAVRDGDVVATLVVDPEQVQDVLLVAGVNDPRTTRLAERIAERVGTPMGRTFTTDVVEPGEHPDVGRRTVALASGLWVVGGFGIAVAWSLVRRRRDPAAVPDGRLLLVVAGTCAGASLLLAGVVAATQGGAFLTWWLLGTFVGVTAAAGTLALEVLLGWAGVAVAGALLVLLATPLLGGRDYRLLPGFWAEVVPWTVHGAARDLAARLTWYAGDVVALRSTWVLLGILLVSLVVVLVAAQVRRPTGADPSEPPQAHWRLRVLAAAVPVALALVAMTVLAPRPAGVVSATPVPGAAETTCVGTPQISTLADLNKFVGTVRGGPAFQGADVGADVGLQDGRRLWVFGDTLRSPDFDGQRFVRNSMLVLGEGCVRSVVPADKGAVVPDRKDGVGYWPMSVARTARDGYDLVGMVTQRVRGTDAPDGAYAFETLGSSLALFVVPVGKTPQLVAQQDLGPDDPDSARPEWGAAAAVDGDQVYLYGTARPDQKGVFGFSLRVARTKIDDFLHPEKWQYWDGKHWQGSAAKAAELIAADHGVSQTLSVFERDGRWYAVSKRDEVFGSDLVVWTAPSPRGPWDGGTKVGTVATDLSSGQLRYMPLAHPDLGHPGPGKVLVSYSRNNTDVGKVEADPFLYRPEFLEIRLP
ncbi:DUF4185 domain-containing protein [Marmoricola sp. RAF53]|uniref:DUF4185 domain-containing protein n=1 Tax=Marmoricola sp. RAF53 TaxID=3233059 RepID=UPI003F963AE3